MLQNIFNIVRETVTIATKNVYRNVLKVFWTAVWPHYVLPALYWQTSSLSAQLVVFFPCASGSLGSAKCKSAKA